MPTVADLLGRGTYIEAHRPWPRVVVDRATWEEAGSRLGAGAATLLGLWGDCRAVHMSILDSETAEIAVLSLNCAERPPPSIGRHHLPAIRLERTLADLFGIVPEGAPDTRPWLDHGRWRLRHPLASREPAPEGPAAYQFLSSEGESLHQIPVGPVHAGIIEPGHFRFTANGETVVRLEARLGYVHKGIEGLMAGSDLATAARLAGRTSGDSAVAYAIAFARAAEAALGIEAPARAHWLRALMGELERLANHLGDIGAICNDAAFALMHAHCGILREQTLRAAAHCFRHRLMRDVVVPGGVAIDLDAGGADAIRTLVAEVRGRFPALVELYDNTASLKDRTFGTGILKQELARRFGAGGFVGRASGRGFDARRSPGYPPYNSLEFEVPVLEAGDVNARVWVRIREIEESLLLIRQLLDGMPEGPVSSALPAHGGEGMALVEGFRGDVLLWLALDDDGRVRRCHLRDPSWFQWPLLEAVIEDNIVADFPLCNKSFNCSYSGHDL